MLPPAAWALWVTCTCAIVLQLFTLCSLPIANHCSSGAHADLSEPFVCCSCGAGAGSGTPSDTDTGGEGALRAEWKAGGRATWTAAGADAPAVPGTLARRSSRAAGKTAAGVAAAGGEETEAAPAIDGKAGAAAAGGGTTAERRGQGIWQGRA